MSVRAPRESDLVRQVLDYLTLCRVVCWRNNTGALVGVYKAKRRFFRFGAVGSPDVFAVLPPSGTLLGIEVKRPGRKPTAAQQAFHAMIASAGAVAVVVTSLAELQTLLRQRGVEP